MKKKTSRKFNYLEDKLKYYISIQEENDDEFESKNGWYIADLKGNEITGVRRLLATIFIPIMLLLVFIVQLPFLLIGNIIILFDALWNGIPFELVPILLPAKRLDLIDNKIKIEIRHNEHAPPHFHIIIDDKDYSMDILKGEYLKNKIKNSKQKKAVEKWYKENKKILIKAWNETRPSDCPVGKIK